MVKGVVFHKQWHPNVHIDGVYEHDYLYDASGGKYTKLMAEKRGVVLTRNGFEWVCDGDWVINDGRGNVCVVTDASYQAMKATL